MTDTVTVAIIAATPPTVVALVALILGLRKLKALHVEVNSKLDQLVDATAAASFAAGKAVGVETERQEVRDRLARKEPRVK